MTLLKKIFIKLLYFLSLEKIYYNYKINKLEKNKLKSYEQVEDEVSKKYFSLVGEKMDWDNPKAYNEKICFSKIYNANVAKTALSDKYEVREWIKNKIGSDYLIPLLGVYDSFKEIDFERLPDEFVIKCNHDSGSVTVVNKKSLTKKELRHLANKYDNYFLKRNYSLLHYETQYNSIKPKILIEEFLGSNISDYKFLCFGGTPVYFWKSFDRFENHTINIYDLKWNLQPFRTDLMNYKKTSVEIPENFDEMVKIAELLCKGFDYVRVDLYNIGGKIYFGEMTFTDSAGYAPMYPLKYNREVGDLWNLDTSSRHEKNRKNLIYTK